MLKTKKVELLAPAGSYEALLAALGAGADAVYLAGDRFGARAYAKNFSQEELLDAIGLCHLMGKKLYLTVNTLLKNREREALPEYLGPLYEAGLDAVLVQDFGALRYLHRVFPDLPLHASTQMTVTGPESLRFLEGLGVTRAVPARELSLSELAAMREASPLEIEVFIHGAMCYCYSGQCLFSSIAGGRSGNRGRCAQPCRLPFSVPERGTCTPLSMKDMLTLPLLPELYEAGVSSLKIEGRMKQPAYVSGVTRIYRKYMDRIESEGTAGYAVSREDREELLSLYSRGGSCEGYYHRDHGREMIFFQGGGKKGEGSEGASLPEPKLSVRGECILREGEAVSLTVWADNGNGEASYTAFGAAASPAQKRPVTREDVLTRLRKVGDTFFAWEELEAEVGENLFLPLGELGSLRRNALEGLQEAFLARDRREWDKSRALEGIGTEKGELFERTGKGKQEKGSRPKLLVSVSSLEILELCLAREEVEGVYLSPQIYRQGKERVLASGKELYLALPPVLRRTPAEFERFLLEEAPFLTGILAGNIESFALLDRLGLAQKCVADHSLYTWNDEAMAFFLERGVLRLTAPLELNEGELAHRGEELFGRAERGRFLEMPVYGYLPLMVSAQCVRGNTASCDKSFSRAALTDEQGRRFVSQCVCKPLGDLAGGNVPCMNVIYNHLPYSLLGERDRVLALAPEALRLTFTQESPREAKRILSLFAGAYVRGEALSPAKGEVFTKGHFGRGVK